MERDKDRQRVRQKDAQRDREDVHVDYALTANTQDDIRQRWTAFDIQRTRNRVALKGPETPAMTGDQPGTAAVAWPSGGDNDQQEPSNVTCESLMRDLWPIKGVARRLYAAHCS